MACFHVCNLIFLCRIENLEQSNEGVYICRASSVYGQAQDTARLTIQGLLHSLQIYKYTRCSKAKYNCCFSFLFHSPTKGDDQCAYFSTDCDDRELRGV